jgi:hypothetical protein
MLAAARFCDSQSSGLLRKKSGQGLLVIVTPKRHSAWRELITRENLRSVPAGSLGTCWKHIDKRAIMQPT